METGGMLARATPQYFSVVDCGVDLGIDCIVTLYQECQEELSDAHI